MNTLPTAQPFHEQTHDCKFVFTLYALSVIHSSSSRIDRSSRPNDHATIIDSASSHHPLMKVTTRAPTAPDRTENPSAHRRSFHRCRSVISSSYDRFSRLPGSLLCERVRNFVS